jgi:hypothetical protein
LLELRAKGFPVYAALAKFGGEYPSIMLVPRKAPTNIVQPLGTKLWMLMWRSIHPKDAAIKLRPLNIESLVGFGRLPLGEAKAEANASPKPIRSAQLNTRRKFVVFIVEME